MNQKRQSKSMADLLQEYKKSADPKKCDDPTYRAAWFQQKASLLLAEISEIKTVLQRIAEK